MRANYARQKKSLSFSVLNFQSLGDIERFLGHVPFSGPFRLVNFCSHFTQRFQCLNQMTDIVVWLMLWSLVNCKQEKEKQ